MEEQVAAKRHGFNVRDAIVFLIDWRKPMTVHDSSLKQPKTAVSSDPTNEQQTQQEDCAERKPSLLSFCLQIVAEVMRAKIRARNNDAIAVVAFGSAGTPTSQRWPGIRVIRSLRESDASGIKRFQQLAKQLETNDAMDGEEQDLVFGDDDEGSDFEFHNALWAVKNQFTLNQAMAKNITHRKKVFIFTNDDDPCRGSNAVKEQSMIQVRDLDGIGATLDITLFASPAMVNMDETSRTTGTMGDIGIGFPQPRKFYDHLVNCNKSLGNEINNNIDMMDEGKEEDIAEAIGEVSVSIPHEYEEMCDRIKRKEATKRAIRVTHLTLASGYKMGVALYALFRKARRPTKVELVAATNEPLIKITNNTCENTAATMKAEDTRHMFASDFVKQEERRSSTSGMDDGNQDSVSDNPSTVLHGFSRAEVVNAKALGKEGLILYGFRHSKYLKKEWCLGPSTFVVGDDSKYVGSMKAFAALHKSMLKKDVIAIVSVRRSESAGGNGMRFAALVAQEEIFKKSTLNGIDTEEDEEDDFRDQVQVQPGGMHLIYMPYKDDMYTAWRKELPVATVGNGTGNEKGVRQDGEVELQNCASGEEEEEGGTTGAGYKGREGRRQLKEEEIISGELDDESESVSKGRRLVRKLKQREGYNAHTFANPDLQTFYHGLELAAGVDSTPNAEDGNLEPRTEEMKEVGGKLMRRIKELDAGEDFDAEMAARRFGTKGGKINVEKHEREMARKQVKEQKRLEAAKQCDTALFEQRYRKRELDIFKVADLKMYCRAHELPERGTKRNLIITVEENIKRVRHERRREREKRDGDDEHEGDVMEN